MNAVNLFAPCHGFKTLGPEKYLGFYFLLSVDLCTTCFPCNPENKPQVFTSSERERER